MSTGLDLSGGSGPQHGQTPAHPALGAGDDPYARRNADAPTDGPTSGERPDPSPAAVPDDGDVFALLSAKAAEVQQEASDLCEVLGHRGKFRLRCVTHVDEKPMRKWQKASVPMAKRKSGQISQFDVDNFILSSRVMLGTTRELAVWSETRKDYVTIPSEEECPFDDKRVLAALGEMLPQEAMRKVFGNRESLVIMASAKVMAYAGWNPDQSMIEAPDDDDDDLDPTPGR